MPQEATIPQPKGKGGEASGKQPELTPQLQESEQKQLTPQEQLVELLKNNPELANSFQKSAPIITTDIVTDNIKSTNTPKPVQRESRIFLLSNGKRKGDVIIDLTDDVKWTDTKTGEIKTRRIRVIRGAQSVWQDEQTALPKEHVAKNQVTLTFSQGRCIIPVHETLKIQAALLSNRNTDNPNRVGHKDIYFYEWNPEKESQKEEEKQNLIIQAMQIAATAKFVDLLPHAQYLGVPVNDEMGIALSEGAIRTSYSKKAMNEPEKFLKSIHSPVVKMTHLVRRAISEGKIDMGRQPNQAFWTDGGFITALPQGREQIEYLVEFAMTSGEANTRFSEQLNAFFST